MGNVKRGNNLYQVLTAVSSGQMTTAFAALGNTVLFYRQAATTANGISATQSYANNNPFPSYGNAKVGDIVSIAGLAAEVDIAVLGQANVASGGGGSAYSQPQGFTPTDGQTVFTVNAYNGTNPPANAVDYRALINGSENYDGINGFTLSVGALSGNSRDVTISPALSSADGFAIQFKI